MDFKKVYVVDTSLLLHDPVAAINLVSDPTNLVVIPIWMLEELDRYKSAADEKGANSRFVSRYLDKLREIGSLKDGVTIGPKGGTMLVDYDGKNFDELPEGLVHSNDNRILLIAKKWQAEQPASLVIIITKDVNLRLKADAMGLRAEDYRKDKSVANIQELYSGFVEIDISKADPEISGELSRSKYIESDKLADVVALDSLFSNQCCRLRLEDRYLLAIYKKEKGIFCLVPKPIAACKIPAVRPLNDEQALACALLEDPTVQLVTLRGKAGTGKTLMSILAGYDLLHDYYDAILIYRANIDLGRPMGFLPGDIREKFDPWADAIYDNLGLILRAKDGCSVETGTKKSKAPVKSQSSKNHLAENPDDSARGKIEYMIRAGWLDISPISFIRGRSLHKSFIIVDEAQNFTPHEIKTIITRVGDGSKIVLTGDIFQIDNPYLDSISNGLSYVVERMKGQPCFGHLDLVKSVRSKVAELGADLL